LFIAVFAEINVGSVLVNMWNHTSFPAYKSRLWDMSGAEQKDGVVKRKPYVFCSLEFGFPFANLF
jgi:hypothetical protein